MARRLVGGRSTSWPTITQPASAARVATEIAAQADGGVAGSLARSAGPGRRQTNFPNVQ